MSHEYGNSKKVNKIQELIDGITSIAVIANVNAATATTNALKINEILNAFK